MYAPTLPQCFPNILPGLHRYSPNTPQCSTHFVSQMDELKDLRTDSKVGMLIDEVSFDHLHINECKKWVSIDRRRKVHCRNTDGTIMANTPLFLSTNMRNKQGRNSFWPALKYDEDHEWALDRRVTWIDITKSCIKNSAPLPILSSPTRKRVAERRRAAQEKKAARQAAEAAASSAPPDFGEDEEDVFSFGGGLDEDC